MLSQEDTVYCHHASCRSSSIVLLEFWASHRRWSEALDGFCVYTVYWSIYFDHCFRLLDMNIHPVIRFTAISHSKELCVEETYMFTILGRHQTDHLFWISIEFLTNLQKISGLRNIYLPKMDLNHHMSNIKNRFFVLKWKVYSTNLPMSNGFTFEMFQFLLPSFWCCSNGFVCIRG